MNVMPPSCSRASARPLTPVAAPLFEPLETRRLLAVSGIDLAPGTTASGVAGFAVHVHASATSADPAQADGALATHRYEWNFGDPNGDHNTLVGYNAAHVYDAPGTYTVTLTEFDANGYQVAGAAAKRTVTVAADNRTKIHVAEGGSTTGDGTNVSQPISVARLKQLLGDPNYARDNKQYLFKAPADGVIEIGGGIDFGDLDNARIGTEPGSGRVRLKWDSPQSPAPYFSLVGLGGGSSNVLVENLGFDTRFDYAIKGIPDAVGIAGNVAGVTVRDSELRNVGDGFNLLSGPSGVLVQDNVSPLKTGLRDYFVWLGTAQNVSIVGNTVANSVYEHVVRGGTGEGWKRVLVADNALSNVAQDESGVSGDAIKSVLNFQLGNYAWATGNTLGRSGITVGPLGAVEFFRDLNNDLIADVYPPDYPDVGKRGQPIPASDTGSGVAATVNGSDVSDQNGVVGGLFGKRSDHARWVVLEGNELQNGTFNIEHGAEHVAVRNNIVRTKITGTVRDGDATRTIASEPAFSLRAASRADLFDRTASDVVFAHNTVSTDANVAYMFVDTKNGGGGSTSGAGGNDIRLYNNILLAPNQVTGPFYGSAPFNSQENASLSGYKQPGPGLPFNGNVWDVVGSGSQPTARNAVAGTYLSPAQWNGLNKVENDYFDVNVALAADGKGLSNDAANVGDRVAGAAFDFFGRRRVDGAGVQTAGAVARAVSSPDPGQCQVVDFEQRPAGYLTAAAGQWYEDPRGYSFRDTTNRLILEVVQGDKMIRNYNFGDTMEVKQTGGGTFTLRRFQHRRVFHDAAATVTGFFADGTTATAQLSYGSAVATQTLNWNNLTRVTIKPNDPAPNSAGEYFYADDFDFGLCSAAPNPVGTAPDGQGSGTPLSARTGASAGATKSILPPAFSADLTASGAYAALGRAFAAPSAVPFPAPHSRDDVLSGDPEPATA